MHEPAWLRRTTEEPRLPVAIAVLVAIGCSASCRTIWRSPWWLLPALELLILVAIVGFRQTSIDRRSRILRALGLSLVVAASLATTWSAVQLIRALIRNHVHTLNPLDNPGLCCATAARSG